MTEYSQAGLRGTRGSVNVVVESFQNHVSSSSELGAATQAPAAADQQPKPTAVYNFTIRTMMTGKSPATSPVYRSVPPPTRTIKIPGEGNQNDSIYQPYLPPKRTVNMNTPWEYADRFKSRPTGRPHVVGFDAATLVENGFQEGRGLNGFFPPVKLRVATPSTPDTEKTRSTSCSARSTRSRKGATKTPPLILELVPEQQANDIVRGSKSARKSSSSSSSLAARMLSGGSTSSRTSQRTNVSQPLLVYPHMEEGYHQFDSLSELPKPKLMISRDNPWVYRYKVKKSMNELSKIMASKAPKKVEFTIKHE